MSELPPAPQAPPPKGPPVARLVVGAILVLLGVGWLLGSLDVAVLAWDRILPVVLIVVGAALVWIGRRGGSHGGLVALGIVLAVVLTVGTFVEVPFGGGIGDRTERPQTAEQVDTPLQLMLGKLTVDLTQLETGGQEVVVRARVGIGQLVVIVPVGDQPEIRARSGIGEARVGDRSEGGIGVELEEAAGLNDPGYRLELSVGIGQVEVIEEGEAP